MTDRDDDMPIYSDRSAVRYPVDRAELEQTIKFVLEQNRALSVGKWPGGRDGAALARAIAEHFERCDWKVTRGPGSEDGAAQISGAGR